MSFESVNVMNKQELGFNSSKTVEHGHDALDSRMSCSSDREEGEMEDGEIDDDDEGKVDEYNDSTSTNDKSPTKPKPTRDNVDSEEEGRMHNSKRHKEHKDRKRRHRKEKRHHHVSHKRRHGSQEEPDSTARRDHSPSVKKSRRGPCEGRRPWDYDRVPQTDEDSGVFGVSHSNGSGSLHRGSGNRSSNHSGGGSRQGNDSNDDIKRSNRRQRTNSGVSSRENEIDRESPESHPSNEEHDSEADARMQDLFSDGDDLDLDVAAHERDGAFQRPKELHRQERQGPRNKKKKNKTQKAKEYWHQRQRREEFMRRRDTERKRCRFYMEGRCGKADHCPYSHDFSPPKKLELCKFYAISSCLKGEYCVYMHDDFPCKFYHTGTRVCKYEKNCKFSHDQLTRDTKKVLERFIEEREENADGLDEKSNEIDPFALGEEDIRGEETVEIPEDRKNSLLGSPPASMDRSRARGGHDSPTSRNAVIDPMSGSSPGMPTQGPTPPPFPGPRQSPQQSQSLGPQPVPPPQPVGAASMPPQHRPFGMGQTQDGMMGAQMGMRGPPMPAQMRPMRPMGAMSSQPMMSNRPGQAFPPNPRMGPMMRQPLGPRPPANMLRPTGGPMHGGGGMMGAPIGQQFGGMGMSGQAYVDPQLDDLASMLVNTVKQQQGKTLTDGGSDEQESTSMLQAAGADDSDLDEEADSLDAMVHRMRKESEEQQRRQRQPNSSGPPEEQQGMRPPRPPFQQFPTSQPQPLMQQPSYSMGYNPQHMFNQSAPPGGMFMGRMPRPVGPPPMQPNMQTNMQSNMQSFPAPTNDENGAAQLYLRIAKQTATGRQEQLARETERAQKSPQAETPASPPMAEPEPPLGPREWKLIPLDVPLKTPYPLMRLPHDLHYSRSDPRLTGQLRLVGSAATVATAATAAPQTPATPANTQVKPEASPEAAPPAQPSPEVGGRAYTPSMSSAALSGVPLPGKDPRLGRQTTIAPEMPAALLKKPSVEALGSLKLEIDEEPPPRPPPKMQLSERASSFQPAQGATGLTSPQAETRAYLMDPRFRRRKASTPAAETTPEHEPQTEGTAEKSEVTKDTTPVPSSGESSPIE